MGLQDQGAFGGFRNKTGPLIGVKRNGQNVITALHTPTSIAPTAEQLEQRMVFKVAQQFVRKVTAIVRQGFLSHKRTRSGYNEAMAYHLKNAVIGTYPNLTIDPELAIFSQGELGMASGATVASLAGSKVKFSWLNPALSDTKGTDLVTVLAYSPVHKRFAALPNVVSRATLNYDLQVPAVFAGTEIHCYLFFTSADKKQVSDSEYLGAIDII